MKNSQPCYTKISIFSRKKQAAQVCGNPPSPSAEVQQSISGAAVTLMISGLSAGVQKYLKINVPAFFS